MAKARAIVKRRKAVRNIRKITQTMQLIATARYQRCLQRATASQPYTRAITQMVETVSKAGSIEHPLLKKNEDADRVIMLVLTSNRGLCGSYNANILRRMMQHRAALLSAGSQVELEVVGKKGLNYCRFLEVPVERSITNVEDKIEYLRVAEMAERYMQLYAEGVVSRVDVAYTKFISTAVQKPRVVTLLPIQPPGAGDDDGTEPSETPVADPKQPDFEFSPPPAELLGKLIPETVKIRLYQYFNDAIVSEQVARMVAMKAATDAAGEMIKQLSQRYNRARQTQITMELLDIVGGAEAIS